MKTSLRKAQGHTKIMIKWVKTIPFFGAEPTCILTWINHLHCMVPDHGSKYMYE